MLPTCMSFFNEALVIFLRIIQMMNQHSLLMQIRYWDKYNMWQIIYPTDEGRVFKSEEKKQQRLDGDSDAEKLSLLDAFKERDYTEVGEDMRVLRAWRTQFQRVRIFHSIEIWINFLIKAT